MSRLVPCSYAVPQAHQTDQIPVPIHLSIKSSQEHPKAVLIIRAVVRRILISPASIRWMLRVFAAESAWVRVCGQFRGAEIWGAFRHAEPDGGHDSTTACGLALSVRVLNRSFKRLSEIDLQRVCDPQKRIHGRIIVIILQAADRGLIQAGHVSDLVLGQLEPLSFGAHEANDFGTNRVTAFSFCHA